MSTSSFEPGWCVAYARAFGFRPITKQPAIVLCISLVYNHVTPEPINLEPRDYARAFHTSNKKRYHIGPINLRHVFVAGSESLLDQVEFAFFMNLTTIPTLIMSASLVTYTAASSSEVWEQLRPAITHAWLNRAADLKHLRSILREEHNIIST